jgi:signal transduction histidine kinase
MDHPRPPGPKASPGDLAAQALREQLRLVFELAPISLAANTVLAATVFLVLADVAPPLELRIWAAAMLGLTAVRAVVVWGHARTPAEGRDEARDGRWYFTLFVLNGLGWGLLPVAVVPPVERAYVILAIGAVYGLAGGGAAFVGHMRGPYGAFLLATLAPTGLKWLADWFELGGNYRLLVGVTTLAFIGLLYGAARQLNRLVAGAIEARLEKEALARRLQELVATVERTNQAKSDFLARLSRQLHAPMLAIAGTAAGLLAPPPAAPLTAAQRDDVQGMHERAEELLAMLVDVLDFSSIEAGRLAIEHVPFDLAGLLARAAAAGELRARARGLAFSCSVAAGVPQRLQGDPRRLAQILANLLSNAVKFTAAGSVALEVKSVKVEGERHTLAFAVRDTGVGIAADRLGGVFQAFTQGEAPGPGDAGHGLGLAICRRLAGLMHGAIAVESEPGRGSVFTLVLALTAVPDGAG